MKYCRLLLSPLAYILLTFNLCMNTMAQTKIVLQTTAGDIKIMLYDDTPKHKENFVKLVEQGYYDGLLFHRVIADFMIQGGDPNSRNAASGQMLGDGGPGYTLPAEFSIYHFHKKGALAAARLGDAMNPMKESSGSQFYIVQGKVLTDPQLDFYVNSGKHDPFTPEQREAYTTVGGVPHLDNAYTVFGEVTEGMEIIDKIAAAQTDSRNRPVADIEIIKAYLAE
ncbi:MAG: peptidylprolyl isomerase [Bacteroidales bacterium]|nr:peptidylprolyl isomerase [Bacteroidales bacterium]